MTEEESELGQENEGKEPGPPFLEYVIALTIEVAGKQERKAPFIAYCAVKCTIPFYI